MQAVLNSYTGRRTSHIELCDGPDSWRVAIPASVPNTAYIVAAPGGSYGAGYAERISGENITQSAPFGGLVAVWPTDPSLPATIKQEAGHARTGAHPVDLVWCKDCPRWTVYCGEHARWPIGPWVGTADGELDLAPAAILE